MAAPGALAAALDGLLTQKDRRLQLGGLARRHCLAHFSRDRVVDQILEYYEFVSNHGSTASNGSGSPVRVGRVQ